MGETLTSLIHVSMKKVNEAATEPAQLSLKILLETPDEIIFDYHADMNGPLVLLLENYLSSSPNVSQQLVCFYLYFNLIESIVTYCNFTLIFFPCR